MMRGYYGGMGFGGGFGPFGILFCILMMLLTVALITVAVIFIIRTVKHGSNPHHMPPVGGVQPFPVPPVLEILNQRLAKGEISVEEYKKLKDEILGK